MAAVGVPFSFYSTMFNPYSQHNHQTSTFDISTPFDLSDCILLEDSQLVESVPPVPIAQTPIVNLASRDSGNRRAEGGKERALDAHRIAFRTKSVVDIMDDGYKWRKYGKKIVKNSPNPRNYYRCSTDGCSVKNISQFLVIMGTCKLYCITRSYEDCVYRSIC